MYYLTFINNKIKDYYIITYFFMLYVLLFVVSLYYIYTLLYIGKRKRQTEEKANGNGREDRRTNRKEPGRRMPPTSSPVLPFRLPVPRSSLFFLPTERPAIASRARGTPSPRWEGVHPVGFWAMPSPHLATTSPASDQQPATTGRRLDGLPSCPPRPRPRPLPLRQVVRGRAESQPGRAILSSSSRRPSPPCRGASEYMRTPQDGEGCAKPSQGGGAARRESLFREFLRGCIALNINYLISPRG